MKAALNDICSDDMAERMRIRQYVQSGKTKTVAEVVQRFGDGWILKANFGWMIHLQNWEVDKYDPDRKDLAQCKGTDKCPASMRIGAAIVSGPRNQIIKVRTPWPLNSRSGNLAPVKNGACSRCGNEVTAQMQNDLADSKEVRCQNENCRIWLFGLGE